MMIYAYTYHSRGYTSFFLLKFHIKSTFLVKVLLNPIPEKITQHITIPLVLPSMSSTELQQVPGTAKIIAHVEIRQAVLKTETENLIREAHGFLVATGFVSWKYRGTR
jgi:hypothetical protein